MDDMTKEEFVKKVHDEEVAEWATFGDTPMYFGGYAEMYKIFCECGPAALIDEIKEAIAEAASIGW